MQHLMGLASDPWIFIPLILLFFGEYLPFSEPLWHAAGERFRVLGDWFVESYESRLYSETDQPADDKKISLKLDSFFARILFFLLSALVVILLELFWELGFRGISRSFERSGVASHVRRWIRGLPGWGVLLLFVTPFFLMELIGIFALGAFVSGFIWFGLGLYLIKVLFFIPVHFILHTGKAQLMAIPWFRRRYDIATGTLDWFKTTQSYTRMHNFATTIKAYFRAVRERFYQSLSLLKKAFEHEELLDPECESIRRKILASAQEVIRREELYERFFRCVDRHLQRPAQHKRKRV